MNKLIEEAENLYKNIDKAQVHLINARLQKDEKGKKSAISEMAEIKAAVMVNYMRLELCVPVTKNISLVYLPAVLVFQSRVLSDGLLVHIIVRNPHGWFCASAALLGLLLRTYPLHVRKVSVHPCAIVRALASKFNVFNLHCLTHL